VRRLSIKLMNQRLLIHMSDELGEKREGRVLVEGMSLTEELLAETR